MLPATPEIFSFACFLVWAVSLSMRRMSQAFKNYQGQSHCNTNNPLTPFSPPRLDLSEDHVVQCYQTGYTTPNGDQIEWRTYAHLRQFARTCIWL
jgi:hypothetical protein